MSAPDRPVQALIAGVLCATHRGLGAGIKPIRICRSCHIAAAAVVAACREATAAQQAQLIDGEVETGNYRVLPHHDKYPFCIPRSCTHREYERHDARIVGPWQPEDPS